MLSSIKNLGLTALIVLFSFSIGLAQDNSERDYNSRGKLISEGGSKSPVGDLAVTTYRLEEIKLDKPIDLRDKKKPIDKAFRLIIRTNNKLPFGDFLIWIDNFNSPARTIRPSEKAIIIYQRNLPNGATIALSKPGKTGSNSYSALSETLSVPSEYATPWEEIQARTPVIKLRKINFSRLKYEIVIERAVEKCSQAAFGNNQLRLEIDGSDFLVRCNNDEAIVSRFTVETFERLTNGSEIALKFGTGEDATNRRVIGRLNKNIFE